MLKKSIFVLFAALLAASVPAWAAQIAVSPYPAHGEAASRKDWQSALKDMDTAGASAMMIAKTWHELEPEKKQYNLAPLAKDMDDNKKAGRAVLLALQSINTVKRDMPADLNETDWDAPEMTDRFRALLAAYPKDAAVPKYVSLANEADVYFDKHPKEVVPFLKFYQRASAAAQAAFPGARMGITVTYEGLRKGRGAVIQQLVDASDVAIFTYYPVVDMKPLPVENVGEQLDTLLKVAGTKDVLLQEVGYPSGAGVGSSEDRQAMFFKLFLSALSSRDQIKLANLFLLHDFTPQLCETFVGYYGFGKVNDDLKQKFRDFICTLGLKNTDGTPKKAWSIVSHN